MEARTEEAKAAELALSGSRWARATTGAKALGRLAMDPDDTRQVFVMGLALNGRHFPEFFARFSATEGGARLLKERPSIDSKSVDFAALRALPANTLGRAYADYLDRNKLDPDLFQTPPGLPEVPAFLARRLRQVHDIWHTLTGYAPNVAGEVALQGFTYAQTGMPSALLIALLGSLRWGLATRGLVASTMDAYERGKEAEFLAPVVWEDHWADDLEEVRQRYRIRVAKALPHRPCPTRNGRTDAIRHRRGERAFCKRGKPGTSSGCGMRTPCMYAAPGTGGFPGVGPPPRPPRGKPPPSPRMPPPH